MEKYPISDWQYEVANGYTLLGYEEWLQNKLEADEAHILYERTGDERLRTVL